MNVLARFIFTKLLSIFVLLYWVQLAGANESLKDEILRDFRPISAHAKLISEGDFLLDIGTTENVSNGDIFTIFTKDDPIYQKGSKKILGYHQKKVAKCTITEVSASQARCHVYLRLSETSGPIEAVRFLGINAAFFVNGRMVLPELQGLSLAALLPGFNWLEPSSKPAPIISKSSMEAFGLDLIFVLKDQAITVYGPGLIPIKKYSYKGLASGTASVIENGEDKARTHGLLKEREGVTQRYSIIDFAEARLLGSLKGIVKQMSVKDVDGDGLFEIAYLLPDRFMLAPFRRKGKVFTFNFEDFETPCCFSIGAGDGYIVISSIIDSAGLNSRLLKLDGESLVVVQDEINLWLSFSHLHCGDTTVRLLGQAFDRQRLRGETIYLLEPTEEGIIYDEPLNLPSDFSIQAVEPVVLDQDTCGYYYVSFDGFLKCYARSRHVWTSMNPIVEDDRDCGPVGTQLLYLDGSLLISGTKKDAKGHDVGAIYLVNLDQGYEPIEVDKNLKGQVAGITTIGNSLIICIVLKEDNGFKSLLYEFDLDTIKKKIKAQQ